jgi:hypothetical protein
MNHAFLRSIQLLMYYPPPASSAYQRSRISCWLLRGNLVAAQKPIPDPSLDGLPFLNGDEGTRTPDLLRAREALSHLSYIPATARPVTVLAQSVEWA